MPAKFLRGSQDRNGYTQHTHSNTGASQFIRHNQQNTALRVIYVMCTCGCVQNRQQSAVCLADRLRAEHSSRTLFSCNNAITGPGAGDTGEKRQQPRHAKYQLGWTSFCLVIQTRVVREQLTSSQSILRTSYGCYSVSSSIYQYSANNRSGCFDLSVASNWQALHSPIWITQNMIMYLPILLHANMLNNKVLLYEKSRIV